MDRLLLTFTGRDAPGITAQISEVLAAERARVLDVEQVVVQGLLVLGFAVAFESAGSGQRVLKELLFAAKQRGLDLEYAPLPEGNVSPRQRFAVTVIARQLGPDALHAVSSVLAAHGGNIERIHRLSEGGLASVEFAVSLPPEADASALKRAL